MYGLKNYNLVVEPWLGNPGPMGRPSGRRGYRWRVTWKLESEFYAEGFEDSHAMARAAAESYLIQQGIEILSLSRRPQAEAEPASGDETSHRDPPVS